MSTQPKTFLTPEEYLAIERKAEYKSEYFEGEMFAMSGAKQEHNLIAGNLYAALHGCMRGRECKFYPSDMRVRTVGRHYCYPDASVVCGKPEFLDGELDTLLNPSLIVEVLSPATEAYDRGRKFELFQSIPSLREYLLLAADRVHADLYVRQENGDWLLRPYRQLADTVKIESIGCELRLTDLYEKVDFAAE